MKKVRDCFCLLLLSSAAWATPLGGAARTVIPSDIQQIISVDYRALRNSETAQVLKEQVLPESLRQFEGALKSVGINPEKDVEQLTFASYRSGKQGVRIVDIGPGQVQRDALPPAVARARAGRPHRGGAERAGAPGRARPAPRAADHLSRRVLTGPGPHSSRRSSSAPLAPTVSDRIPLRAATRSAMFEAQGCWVHEHRRASIE